MVFPDQVLSQFLLFFAASVSAPLAVVLLFECKPRLVVRHPCMSAGLGLLVTVLLFMSAEWLRDIPTGRPPSTPPVSVTGGPNPAPRPHSASSIEDRGIMITEAGVGGGEMSAPIPYAIFVTNQTALKMTFVAALRDNTTGLVWGQYRVDIDPGTEERLPFLAYITNSCYTPLVLRARSLKGEFLIGEWLQPPSAAK